MGDISWSIYDLAMSNRALICVIDQWKNIFNKILQSCQYLETHALYDLLVGLLTSKWRKLDLELSSFKHLDSPDSSSSWQIMQNLKKNGVKQQ